MDLICFDCLTDDNKHVPAVTLYKGSAVCEKCAREWAEHQANQMPSLPLPNINLGL